MEIANTFHRTLIIRFSSVGDVVLSSLLIRALHKRFPGWRTDYLTKSEYADLVRHHPHVSSVIEFPPHGGLRELWQVRQAVHKAGYDLVVDIHNSVRSRFVSFGLRNVVRIRKRKIARFFLVKTKWNLYRWFGGSPGIAERYLEPVRSLGVENDGGGLEVFVPPSAENAAGQLLAGEGMTSGQMCIGIAPSARHFNKMWPGERFAETAATLARENNAPVLLFGSGKNEAALCEDVKFMIEKKAPGTIVKNFAGRLSLAETAAMMDSCRVLITNDSGLMHIAAARKRRVVAIFGPTVRELGFFPYGTESTVVEDRTVPCRPCTHIGLPRCPRGHFNCMKNIPPLRVIEAARTLLTRVPVT